MYARCPYTIVFTTNELKGKATTRNNQVCQLQVVTVVNSERWHHLWFLVRCKLQCAMHDVLNEKKSRIPLVVFLPMKLGFVVRSNESKFLFDITTISLSAVVVTDTRA